MLLSEDARCPAQARLGGTSRGSEGRVVQRWTAEEHAQLARLVEQFGGDRRCARYCCDQRTMVVRVSGWLAAVSARWCGRQDPVA
jgi:hypothetical protein